MQNLSLQCNPYRLLQYCIRRYNSNGNKTYYDILEVPMDSNKKEIREAFVRLSKKYHPDVLDVNTDPKLADQFVKIIEAYQILSKPRLRIAYDQDLSARVEMQMGSRSEKGATTYGQQTTEFYRPWEIKPNYNPNPGHYYGFKGVDKVPNSRIVLFLIAFGITSAVIGYYSLKTSLQSSRKSLDEKSTQASSFLALVRADAQKYGNEEQLRRLVNRINSRD